MQYALYLDRLVHGNLGQSYSTGESVRSIVLSRLPATIALAAAGLLVEVVIGLPLGILAALKWQSLADRAVLTGSLLGVVMPQFVLGFLLLYFFAYKIPIFPLGATASLPAVVLPALALGLPGAAWYARMVRSSVLNVLGEDYVRNCRAKGLSEWVVVLRHVLRNSAGPAITMIGLDFGIFLGGVLIVEQVFGWPGIGQQMWNAISANDIPVVMGTVIVAATAVVIFNLCADIANAFLDPADQVFVTRPGRPVADAGQPLRPRRATPAMMRPAILEVRGLSTVYGTSRGQIEAVKDVSFEVLAGEAVGIVGESGCGKTALALSLLRLLPRNGRISNGRVLLEGLDLVTADRKTLRNLRGRRIAMVFQDSMTSLDPVMPIGRPDRRRDRRPSRPVPPAGPCSGGGPARGGRGPGLRPPASGSIRTS